MCDRFPISLLWTFSPSCWQRKLIQFFFARALPMYRFHMRRRKWCIWFFGSTQKELNVSLWIFIALHFRTSVAWEFLPGAFHFIYIPERNCCARVLSRTHAFAWVTKWKVLHSLFSLFATRKDWSHAGLCTEKHENLRWMLFLSFTEIIWCCARRGMGWDCASVWKQLSPQWATFHSVKSQQ